MEELKKRIGFSKINSLIKFLKSGVGFTLVELLIAIAIIGVVAAGLITVINPVTQFQKAQDSRRKSDLSQVQKSLETFYQDNRVYPEAVNNKIKRLDGTTANWGESWSPYMSILPKDPASSKNYIYLVSTDRQTHYLYANLDRGGNDPQACFTAGNPCGNAITNNVGTSCGGNCNYGISSQNVSP